MVFIIILFCFKYNILYQIYTDLYLTYQSCDIKQWYQIFYWTYCGRYWRNVIREGISDAVNIQNPWAHQLFIIWFLLALWSPLKISKIITIRSRWVPCLGQFPFAHERSIDQEKEYASHPISIVTQVVVTVTVSFRLDIFNFQWEYSKNLLFVSSNSDQSSRHLKRVYDGNAWSESKLNLLIKINA